MDHKLLTGESHFPDQVVGPCLVGMLSGSGVCRVNGQTEPCEAGSYVVVNQGSRLGLKAQGQAVILFFQPEVAKPVLERAPGGWSWLERAHPMSPEFRDQLDWLIHSAESCSSFGALRADGIAREILEGLTARAIAFGLLSERLKVARVSTRVELIKRVSQAREWITGHYASPATLEDMAAVASLNRQHFLRIFRQVYEVTPHQFLTRTRLEKAAELLRGSDEPVSKICQLTGFESLSSFSGLFKARFGSAPTIYRAAPTDRASARR